MLILRYCAFFKADQTSGRNYAELALSMMTVERNVAPYADIKVVVYTLAEHRQSMEELLSQFDFPSEVMALDQIAPERYEENRAFASGLSNLTEVDRICTIRMLSDFEFLDSGSHRLLLGTDIFFLDCPQEILAFVWGPNRDHQVLFMQDLFSFAGAEYTVRYYHPPILKSLLGDFYCLAPGVTLDRSALIGCLKMIDGWPVVPSRFDPPTVSATAPEQHAAAILLQPYGGQPLPSSRYAHIQYHGSLAVLHTHDVGAVLRHLGEEAVSRFTAITGFQVTL